MTATIYSSDFNRVIAATKGFISNNNISEFRKYIRLEFCASESSMTAMAVDGYRMSVEHAVCECDEDFVTYIHGTVKLPGKMNAVIEVTDFETLIRCGDFIFGCPRLKGEDTFNWRAALPGEPAAFRIGFNGNLLLSALQAAKASCGGLKEPVVLEFSKPINPIILRTGKENIKLVMPVRIKD